MRFLLVDEIKHLTAGKDIVAFKTFPATEELFQDHFPGFPVVPGVLLTEMMAQSAGKCLYAEDFARGRPILAQIRKASFRSWVKPDEKAHIYAEITSSQSSFAIAKCRIEVGNNIVAQAEVLFSFASDDLFAKDYRDEVLDKYLNSQ